MNEAEIDFEISNHMISCIIDMRVIFITVWTAEDDGII